MNDASKPKVLILVWEFHVHPEKNSAFERAYGPDGDWAQLFRGSQGYMRTELYRDAKSAGRYFTLDHWQSREAFDSFRRTDAEAYAALDAKCELLTKEEIFIGERETRKQALLLLPEGAENVKSSPSARIRPATSADISALLSLEQSALHAAHWSVTTYERMFHPDVPARIALVAENDSKALCGFCVARIGPAECELENIVVAEAQRQSGIGRMLLHTVIGAAREKNVATIHLEVRESNQAARAFYESCGFRLSGRRKGYYSAPAEDALIYILSL